MTSESKGGGDGEQAEENGNKPDAEQGATDQRDPASAEVVVDGFVAFGLDEVEWVVTVEDDLGVDGGFDDFIIAPTRGNGGEVEDAEEESEEKNEANDKWQM